jgi:hypothetical protein
MGVRYMPITQSFGLLIKLVINQISYISNLIDILDKFESSSVEGFILSCGFTVLFVYFVSSKLETMEG